jgi:hypothetical protein
LIAGNLAAREHRAGGRGRGHGRVACGLAVVRVGEKLELDGAVAEAVLAEEGHGLEERVPARPVLVEEVAGHEDHVDVVRARELEDLFEGADRVAAAYRVALVRAEVAVGRDKDPDRVLGLCARVRTAGSAGRRTQTEMTDLRRGRVAVFAHRN